MVPHQPKNKVVRVLLVNSLSMHFLHSLPFIVAYLRITISPTFWLNSTCFVGAKFPQIWQPRVCFAKYLSTEPLTSVVSGCPHLRQNLAPSLLFCLQF